MKTIQEKIILNETNPDRENRKTISSIFHTDFDAMINYFDHSDSLFKKYPLHGSPPLIKLALLIAVLQPQINTLSSLEAKTPQLICKIRDVLKDYRRRSVEARLHKLSITNELYEDIFVSFMGNLRTFSYSSNGYGKWKSLQCRKGCDADTCVKDEFCSDQYHENNDLGTDCISSYTALVRHRVEQVFSVELLDKLCDEKPKTPTV